MCFGIAPGQLSIAPRLFNPQSMPSHIHTRAHTHHLNKQKFNMSRLSVLSSQFRIPEYVSASPNDASTRRDTKEEQTGKRDGCEKPSLAVTLTSLSLTHCHCTQGSRLDKCTQIILMGAAMGTCLRTYSFHSLNVYTAPIMFVLSKAFQCLLFHLLPFPFSFISFFLLLSLVI